MFLNRQSTCPLDRTVLIRNRVSINRVYNGSRVFIGSINSHLPKNEPACIEPNVFDVRETRLMGYISIRANVFKFAKLALQSFCEKGQIGDLLKEVLFPLLKPLSSLVCLKTGHKSTVESPVNSTTTSLIQPSSFDQT